MSVKISGRNKGKVNLTQGIMAVLLIMLLTAAYFYVWYFYYNDLMPIVYYRRGHILIIAVYVVILSFMFVMYGTFRITCYRTGELVYSSALSVLITNFITYLQICLIGTWILTPIPMLVLTVVEFPVAVIWTVICKRIIRRLSPGERLLLVYKDKSMPALINKLDMRRDKFNIVKRVRYAGNNNERLSLHGYDLPAEGDVVQESCITGMEKLQSDGSDLSDIRTGSIRELLQNMLMDIDAVVLSTDIRGAEREQFLCECYRFKLPVYIIPQISDVLLSGAERLHLFDTPLHLLENNGIRLYRRVVKRVFDIIISLIILVIFLPVMLVVASAIYLYDRGSVFYRQNRITEDGREFRMLKFRSMRISENDNEARLAEKEDKRITPIGKIIRQLHVDELPQLINILKGDMSLVGPRPEQREIIEEYKKHIPEFDFRLRVRAGLSGYAQVYGKYNTTPEDKLKLDLYYIENYSFWLDMKLLLMTVKVLFQKEATEGVESGQLTAIHDEKSEDE